MGSPPPRSLLVIAAGIVLVLFLDGASPCYGGKTSFYARKVEKTVDMPLDADVFEVPPGYNAPQQVCCSDSLNRVMLFYFSCFVEFGLCVCLFGKRSI